MKTLSKITLTVLLLSLPFILNGQEKKDKKVETIKYMTSIDCEACVSTIMNNLPKEKGIRDVKCNLVTKEVTVTYQKEKTDRELVRRQIEKLGYSAKPLTEEKSPEKEK